MGRKIWETAAGFIDEEQFRRICSMDSISDEVFESVKDGEKAYYSLAASVKRDRNGRLLSVVSVIRDVTQKVMQDEKLADAYADLEIKVQERTAALSESKRDLEQEVNKRKTFEEELRRQRNFINAILNIADALVLVLNAAGMVLQANNTCERVLGHKTDDFKGKFFWDFFSADALAIKAAFKMLEDGTIKNFKFESECRTKKGERKDIAFGYTVIRKASGGIEYVVATGTDVTERKKREEKIKKLADKLSASNEELERFASVVSHDLREPLRAVSSYTLSLAERYRDKISDEADQYIQNIVDCAESSNRLIQDLLLYAKHGQVKPPVEVDLEEILRKILSNLKLQIEESGAAVTHGPLPKIIADEAGMVQLLQNLVSNALKFHGPAPPRVHVSAKQVFSGGQSEWVFSVRDNGLGIKSEDCEKIFVMSRTRAKYPGSAMGLALCKKIVTQHGGRIWAEANPDGGCTFHFTLPRSIGMAAAA